MHNNPLTHIDPDGLLSFSVDLGRKPIIISSYLNAGLVRPDDNEEYERKIENFQSRAKELVIGSIDSVAKDPSELQSSMYLRESLGLRDPDPNTQYSSARMTGEASGHIIQLLPVVGPIVRGIKSGFFMYRTSRRMAQPPPSPPQISSGTPKQISMSEPVSPGYTKSNLKLGQEIHKSYKADVADGAYRVKEYKLPSGRKIDFLDIVDRKIYELKPFNPRSIKQGQKQLELYKKELESIPEFEGYQWETILDIY